MSDTARLDWYLDHVAANGEYLCNRLQPDRHMAITAYGQVTKHVLWHWPMDRSNSEYRSAREAIDVRMQEEL